MLKQEFQYYLDNQEKIVKKYNGKVVVIIGRLVVGAYDNYSNAYHSSLKKYKPGTFLLQKCSPGNKDYTISLGAMTCFI